MLTSRALNIARLGLFAVILPLLGYYIGNESLSGNNVHVLLGLALTFLAVGLSTQQPAVVLFGVLVYLPFMGVIRRLLFVYMGQVQFDPMVTIEPFIVLLLGSYWFYHYLIRRDAFFEDTKLFRLVRWMIFIDVLEVLNPLQHGVTVGLSGLMFYVVPLFWMLLSRVHFNDRAIRILVRTVFIIGIVMALYGLKQTYFGFFPFEKTWVQLSGYTSLHVGNKLRAFSTPDNAQEYATYLAVGASISWVYLLRGHLPGKIVGVVGLGITGFALFMASVRSTMVLAILSISLIAVVHAKSVRSKVIVATIFSILLVGTFLGISHISTASQNALISHQINGLAHPFNSTDSSLSGHSSRMFSGIVDGFKMPIGYGLGSTTVAAAKFNALSQGTEIDISNMFMSDGILGGLLYIGLIGRMFFVTIRNTQKDEFLHLVTLGVIVVGAGQWSNGGLYSVSALIWVMIGYVDRKSIVLRERSSSRNHSVIDEWYT